jgi:hypothetical protein
LLELISMNWNAAAFPSILGLVLGVASYLLCRNRNDLIYC